MKKINILYSYYIYTMPYIIRKLPKKDLYRVYNKDTKEIHSYGTTLEKAKKQVRLLHMVDSKKGGNVDMQKYKDYPKLQQSLQGGAVINRFRPWNWFCHKKAKDLGITYSCAIVDPNVKNQYRELKKNPNFNIDWLIKNYDTSKTDDSTEIINDEIKKIEEQLPETNENMKDAFYETKQKIEQLLQIANDKGLAIYGTNDELFESILYLYLLKKYGNKCSIAGMDNSIYGISLGIKVFTDIDLQNRYIDENIDRIAKQINDCINKGVKVILIPLSIIIKNPINNELNSHANLLIVRIEKKIVNGEEIEIPIFERFEPHGSITKLSSTINTEELVNDALETMISDYIINGLFIYRTPNILCPRIKGFQSIEGQIKKNINIEKQGYCVIWSMLLMELLLLNPTKSTKELIDEMFKILGEDPNRYKNLIVGYVNETNEIISELIKSLTNENFKFLTQEELNEMGTQKKFRGNYTQTHAFRTKGKWNFIKEWFLQNFFELQN